MTTSPANFGDRRLARRVRLFFRSSLATVALFLLIAICLSAILAPLISPQNPYDLRQLNILNAMKPPGFVDADGRSYLLGTDAQGRDMLSAIFYGLRISLGVGLASVAVASCIGASVGVAAAYIGGRVDSLITRIIDIQLSFPAILIALVLLATVGRGVDKVIIALVLVQWAYYARTVRAAALVEQQKGYIEAARSFSMSKPRIIFLHLLPNCLPPLIVVATMQIASAITLEATLSFLGMGVPVTEPSLGMLIANGYHYVLSGRYWMTVFPGLALAFAIVAINLTGDRLSEIFDPRRIK